MMDSEFPPPSMPLEATGTEALFAPLSRQPQKSVPNETNLVRRLWSFVRPHRPWLIASLVCIVAINGLGLVVPLVVRDTFDARSFQEIQRAGLRFLIIIGVQQTLLLAQKYSMHVVGVRVAHDLRMAVIGFLQGQRLAFFEREPAGALVTRVTADSEAVRDMFRYGVLNALGDALLLVGIVGVMLVLNWRLALVVFTVVPVIVGIVEVVRRRARRAIRDVRDRLARLTACLAEQIDGVGTVQSYCAEPRVRADFVAINEAHREATFRHTALQGLLPLSIQLVSSVAIAAVFWYIGVHMAAPEIGFGTLVAFVYYIRRFFEPLGMLGARYTQLQSSLTGAERIFELIDRKEPDAPVRVLVPPGNPAYEFEFDHVAFGYRKEAPVLRDVSFSVRRGEKIAVVGTTGCGKSTLMSLLLRIRDADDGAIRVRGHEVRSFSREELRRQFSVVPQDPFLFSGTLASNIAGGDATVDEARAEAALREVGGGNLIDRRRDGIRAEVKPRGANLSLGERQLVAFARALYRNASILLLDEATASVDTRTEALLQRALHKLLMGRSALIIAHRLSTIHSADRILVLQDGHIVESGNHDELMSRQGIYAKAYDLQRTRQTLTQTLRAMGDQGAA